MMGGVYTPEAMRRPCHVPKKGKERVSQRVAGSNVDGAD